MATLSGIVLGQDDIPLANMPVTLLGSTATSVVLTDNAGKFSFTGLTDDSYDLVATHRVLNTASQRKATIKDGEDPPAVTFRLIADDPEFDLDDGRFTLLKYAQYAFLMLIGFFFFYLIYLGVNDLKAEQLKEIGIARGVITYLVAVTTIAMAAMLMLTGIMTGGKNLSQRFTLGKEILTTLIGVLGTIIGFYYGSTEKPDTAPDTANPSAITVNGFKPTPPNPRKGGSLSISPTIAGGQPPYTYTLTASPTGIIETINKSSADGRISEKLPVSNSATSGAATLTLTIKDATGTSFPVSTTMTVQE